MPSQELTAAQLARHAHGVRLLALESGSYTHLTLPTIHSASQ